MTRGPAKKATAPTARRGGSKDRKTETRKYSQPVASQIIPFQGVRPCVACGVFVGNLNLGGYDGRSAMTGNLFCLKCTDRAFMNTFEREGGRVK
jgi:hypothetical protein